MLTEICQYLHNFFDYKRYIGEIKVISGEDGLYPSDELHPGDEINPSADIPVKIYCNGKQIEIEEGQYFALFRDKYLLGVYQEGDDLPDKNFSGAVWLMDLPEAILKANQWADDWMKANGGVDNAASSPFQSESFGGYSYSKSSGNGKIGGSIFDQAVFVGMLAPYRKLR